MLSFPDPEVAKREPYRAYTEHLLSEGFSYILNHDNLRKVVISHIPSCSWHNVVDIQNPSNHNFDSILRDGFARTFNALTKAGKEIYIVLDNPIIRRWPKCNASVVRRPVNIPAIFVSKNEKSCSIKQSERIDLESVDNWHKIANETASGYKNIHFIDLAQVFCKNGRCSLIDDKGNMLYRDDNHLNAYGSVYAAPFIMNELRK